MDRSSKTSSSSECAKLGCLRIMTLHYMTLHESHFQSKRTESPSPHRSMISTPPEQLLWVESIAPCERREDGVAFQRGLGPRTRAELGPNSGRFLGFLPSPRWCLFTMWSQVEGSKCLTSAIRGFTIQVWRDTNQDCSKTCPLRMKHCSKTRLLKASDSIIPSKPEPGELACPKK